MKRVVAVLAFAIMASTAMAQPYYVAGSHQGWDPNPPTPEMVDMGGYYQSTLTGVTGEFEYKVSTAGWGSSWPTAGNVKGLATGDYNVYYYPEANPNDGWLPNEPRVGYDDPGYGWVIMGSFNGWGSAVATMVDQGGGVFHANFTVEFAGDYELKFRKTDGWELSVGNGFGPSNIPYHVDNDGDTVYLALDVGNGRYSLTPEPATLALLGLGAFALIRRR